MYHGELISIHSEAFNRWLYDKLTKNGQLVYQSYWIGMRSMCANCPLMWTDGSPLDYEDWQPGEPNSPSVENCVELHTFPSYHTEEYPGLWNDHGCQGIFFPLCEYYPNGNPHDGQDWPTEGGCPKGWSQFAGNCYIIPIDGNSISDGLKYKACYHFLWLRNISFVTYDIVGLMFLLIT